MRNGKVGNEYADELAGIDASKTVWKAIAFSFAMHLAGEQGAVGLCFSEWEALHSNGIVPQKPKRKD